MAQTDRKPSRGLRWALLISVTLNLLVIGVVVGGILGHDRHPPHPVVGDVSLGVFSDALSPEDRAALRKAAQTHGPDFRQMRDQSRADMAALIAALEADPWNRTEVEQILERHKARTMERVDIGETMIFNQLVAMTPEARRDFAARLKEAGERFRARREGERDRDRDGPPPGGPPRASE